MLAAVALGMGLAPPLAAGSPAAEAIIDEVDIATYQHYLEDLLYTHLGHNRGFGAEHDRARSNIVTTLSGFGLSVALEPFVYSGTTYYNVVATQTGTELPEEVIVVGAHFDSVNNPGADDNGTGTALVMEVARVLSRHRSIRTIRYVLFDREEQGRRGSIAFVNAHSAENIIQAVTADMVGHDSGAYAMDIYGRTTTSSQVMNGMAAAIDAYGDSLGRFLNFGNYNFSDHASFELAGIPAFVIIERCYTCNTNYHTANDAVDIYPGYISYPMLADLVRSVTGYLVDVVNVVVYGDGDEDTDVDLADIAGFQDCLDAAASGFCIAYDLDHNGTVELGDLGDFISRLTGP